ncbi:hypothetical protein Emed_003466 [Eimeria media]
MCRPLLSLPQFDAWRQRGHSPRPRRDTDATGEHSFTAAVAAATTTVVAAAAVVAVVAIVAAATATVVVAPAAAATAATTRVATVQAAAAAAATVVVAATAATVQAARAPAAEGQPHEQAAFPSQTRLLVCLSDGLWGCGPRARRPRVDVEALTGALQKVTVDGGEMEMAAVEESLSSSERAVVLKLKQLQEEHAALSAVFEAAVLRLKLEYEEKYKPLYQKRLEALTPPPTEEQAADKAPMGTPANRLLADIIEEQDEEPLSYLRNIECEWVAPAVDLGASPPAKAEGGEGGAPHPESFRLVFTFTENPYFEPLVLTKEYRLSTVPGGRGAELTSTKSTRIKWRPEKDVTKKTVIRKQRNRKTKQTRTVAETVDANSFFNLFVDHEVPSDDKLEQMEEKEGVGGSVCAHLAEGVEELQMVVEADYDIGITIRDKIIPRAVDWFLGQVDDDSDFEDYDINDEDLWAKQCNLGDSEESDEDEDSSDDEPPRHSKGAAKATIDAKGGPDQKPECKQHKRLLLLQQGALAVAAEARSGLLLLLLLFTAAAAGATAAAEAAAAGDAFSADLLLLRAAAAAAPWLWRQQQLHASSNSSNNKSSNSNSNSNSSDSNNKSSNSNSSDSNSTSTSSSSNTSSSNSTSSNSTSSSNNATSSTTSRNRTPSSRTRKRDRRQAEEETLTSTVKSKVRSSAVTLTRCLYPNSAAFFKHWSQYLHPHAAAAAPACCSKPSSSSNSSSNSSSSSGSSSSSSSKTRVVSIRFYLKGRRTCSLGSW